METNRATRRHPEVTTPMIPMPGGADGGTKWLIGAVLAAGQDGCDCPACQMLKKFGGALSKSLLQEEGDGGNPSP